MLSNWAVTCADADALPRAQALARRWEVPLLARPDETGVVLEVGAQALALHLTGPNAPGPLRIDFTSGAMRQRLRTSGRRSLIGRALGFNRRPPALVVDATAGLGQDGFVIAALGARVVMIERVTPLFLLLEDALARAARHADTAPIADRIELVHGDARDWLAAAGERPDAVHLDPMYPKRSRHALSAKGMQLAQHLAGDDADAPALLEAARSRAPRVAVKRPNRAGPLGGVEPQARVEGRKTRYDLYLQP